MQKIELFKQIRQSSIIQSNPIMSNIRISNQREIRVSSLASLIAPTVFQPRGKQDLPDITDKMYRIPDNQRYNAWNLSKKQFLVDSILHNYPMSGINMTQHFEMNNQTGNIQEYFNIGDGQCRLTALHEYYTDQYPVNITSDTGIVERKLFSELSTDYQNAFTGYQVMVEVFKNTTKEQMADNFERLNSGKPLSKNDLFYNRKDTPVVSFVYDLIKMPEFREDIDEFFGHGIGGGKTRKNLGDMVGLVLAAGLGSIQYNNTSYLSNGDALSTFSPLHKERVILFITDYFDMLHNVLDEVGGPTRKGVYGKLSGILGLALGSWILHNEIKECICWYVMKLHQNPNYVPATFDNLTSGDLRNNQGNAIPNRLSALQKQYEMDNASL